MDQRARSVPPGAAGRVFRRYQPAFGNALRETRDAWPALSLYERFEQVIALILTLLISLIIVAALAYLMIRVIVLFVYGHLDPAEQNIFQAVFGMIMTVLIALEFNHSILGVLERKHSIIQLRTVVLIALLALVRKFIIIDATKVEPLTLVGLAGAVLALAAVYWIVRDRDRMAPRAALPRGCPRHVLRRRLVRLLATSRRAPASTPSTSWRLRRDMRRPRWSEPRRRALVELHVARRDMPGVVEHDAVVVVEARTG